MGAALRIRVRACRCGFRMRPGSAPRSSPPPPLYAHYGAIHTQGRTHGR
jgi:hypothetical protein